jgi:hypothetical protein
MSTAMIMTPPPSTTRYLTQVGMYSSSDEANIINNHNDNNGANNHNNHVGNAP